MDWKEVPGLAGLLFSLIYRIPQIVKLWKTKEGKDLSLWSYCLQTCAYIGFGAHVMLHDPDLILMTYYVTGFLSNIIILKLASNYGAHFWPRKIEVYETQEHPPAVNITEV